MKVSNHDLGVAIRAGEKFLMEHGGGTGSAIVEAIGTLPEPVPAPCSVCTGSRVLLTGEPCLICSQTGLESDEIVGLRKECFRLERELEQLEGKRAPAHGTKEAVIEAVRLLCGEAPEYLEDSDQWSMPDSVDDRTRLGHAIRELVAWLDEHATKGDEG